jgi:ubiquinone/menaquinone biosynthesis C-methylase UbiE
MSDSDLESQKNIFIDGEGDAWYQRNQQSVDTYSDRPTTRLLIDTLKPMNERIASILEVGCGNGIELERLCRELDAAGIGIEPSVEAVRSGNLRVSDNGFPIDIQVGTADTLPCTDESIDLLYFGFCLYLVDRKDILMAFAEAHRVLKPGGFLAILDFDPSHPHRRAYVHHDGVYSYKQDYSRILLSTEMYTNVARYGLSHHHAYFEFESDERISLTILHKEIQPYPEWRAAD